MALPTLDEIREYLVLPDGEFAATLTDMSVYAERVVRRWTSLGDEVDDQGDYTSGFPDQLKEAHKIFVKFLWDRREGEARSEPDLGPYIRGWESTGGRVQPSGVPGPRGEDTNVAPAIAAHDALGTAHQVIRETLLAAIQGNATALSVHEMANETRFTSLDATIAVIQASIASLVANEGDLALIQLRFDRITDAGVKLQLSKDGGSVWADVPGLHTMGLAEFHAVPDEPASWAVSGANEVIPNEKLANGPRAVGAVPALSSAGGVFTANWHVLPTLNWLVTPPAATFSPVTGSEVIRFNPDTVGDRPQLYTYHTNAWHLGFTWPDHRFHAGTTAPSALLGENGEYYLRHDGTNATEFYLKNGGAWGKLCDFGTGSGAGLTQAQVDARVAALVQGQARVGNTAAWPVSKVVSSGRNANRWLRISSDGNTIVGHDAPTWIDDPANNRIPAGQIGTQAATNKVLTTHNNVSTWRTYLELATDMQGSIFNLLNTASNQITYDGSTLTVTADTPSAAALLPRFKTGEVRIDPNDNTKLDIQFPSGGTVDIPLGFFRQFNRAGTDVIGFWRVGHGQNDGNDGTVIDATGGWLTDSDGWSIASANAVDFSSSVENLSGVYYPGFGSPFSGNFPDLDENPFIVGERNSVTVAEGKLLIDENDLQLYKAGGNPQHGASWTLRAYGTSDLGAGQTFRGYVDDYHDLPTSNLNDGDAYFVRGADGFGVWIWVASTGVWSGYNEQIFDHHAFPNEATALAAVAGRYHDDDDFNGEHVAYWTGGAIAAFTCTDYTAAAASTLYWARQDQAILSRIDVLHDQIHERPIAVTTGGGDAITSIWRGTQAQYTALASKDADTLYLVTAT